MALDPYSELMGKTSGIDTRLVRLEEESNSLEEAQEAILSIHSQLEALKSTAEKVDDFKDGQHLDVGITLFSMQERLARLASKYEVSFCTPEEGLTELSISVLQMDVQELFEKAKEKSFLEYKILLEKELSLKERIEQLSFDSNEIQIEQLSNSASSFNYLHLEYFQNQFALAQNGNLLDGKTPSEVVSLLLEDLNAFISTRELLESDQMEAQDLMEKMKGFMESHSN